jgi:hypothetical protein
MEEETEMRVPVEEGRLLTLVASESRRARSKARERFIDGTPEPEGGLGRRRAPGRILFSGLARV